MSFHEHVNINSTLNGTGISGSEMRGSVDQAMLMTFNNYYPQQ